MTVCFFYAKNVRQILTPLKVSVTLRRQNDVRAASTTYVQLIKETTMTVKLADGTTKDVTGMGVGGTALGLGIAGTALGLLNGGTSLFGNGIGGKSVASSSDDSPVTRYEANLLLAMNAKDGEIAQLKADQYTDRKLVEVFNALNDKANNLTDRFNAKFENITERIHQEHEAQAAINLQQAVYNGTASSTMTSLQQQISALQAITKTVIPQYNVCTTGCCCGCNQQ